MGVGVSLEFDRESMRQAEMEGVYNGEPGFGFNSARYCVSNIAEWRVTFFSTLFAWNIWFNRRTVSGFRPSTITPVVFLSKLYNYPPFSLLGYRLTV